MIPPEPGRRGWAMSIRSFPLPAELAHGTPVKVLKVGTHVHVLDDELRLWQLQPWQVDVGREYRIDGGPWLPESDPVVLNALQSALGHWIQAPSPHTERRKITEIALEAQWILRRNGITFSTED